MHFIELAEARTESLYQFIELVEVRTESSLHFKELVVARTGLIEPVKALHFTFTWFRLHSTLFKAVPFPKFPNELLKVRIRSIYLIKDLIYIKETSSVLTKTQLMKTTSDSVHFSLAKP